MLRLQLAFVTWQSAGADLWSPANIETALLHLGALLGPALL